MKNTQLFCIPVESEDVLNRVIDLVRSAKREIIVTHSGQDESKIKPNSKYFTTLCEMKDSGVTVIRYIFGNDDFPSQDKFGISQVYGGTAKQYQRTIIVDGKKAMFKLGDHFYYTTNHVLCQALKLYVEARY